MQIKKPQIFFLLIIFFITAAYSQSINRPRLVVGIVIDQMRYDYLFRFENCYGEDGFKRFIKDGTNFTFAHYNYLPTSTGPGHASIYTGAPPFYSGIIANDFYDRVKKNDLLYWR